MPPAPAASVMNKLPVATVRTTASPTRNGRNLLILMMLALGGLAVGVPASAKDVAAGTSINNTATVSYKQSGHGGHAAASTSFLVDQLLDVTVTWQDDSPVLAPAGATDRSTLFKVTNTGNGSDSYTLTLTALPGSGEDFSMADCRLYLDSDGNGIWTDADTAYVPGTNDPQLAADQSAQVLALCNFPEDANDQRFANVQLKAISTTFSGSAGDSRPSKDIDGMELVLGSHGNHDTAQGTYQANAVTYTFDSTQQVSDSRGGQVARSGSTILYTLTVHAHGNATGRDLIVTDPIPDHTTYVPGTLVLDNGALGDSATDGDAGDFDITAANAITVNLGDMAGTAPPHVIAFKVRIN